MAVVHHMMTCRPCVDFALPFVALLHVDDLLYQIATQKMFLRSVLLCGGRVVVPGAVKLCTLSLAMSISLVDRWFCWLLVALVMF